MNYTPGCINPTYQSGPTGPPHFSPIEVFEVGRNLDGPGRPDTNETRTGPHINV